MAIDRGLLRYVAYTTELLLLAAAQSTPELIPQTLGAKPLLLVSAALSFCAVENATASMILGAVCGAATDLAGGGIGYYALALTLTCFFISSMLGSRFRANLFSLMLFSSAAVAAVVGGYFLLFRLPFGADCLGALFPSRYLPRMALTYLCVPPLYGFNYYLKNFIFKNRG